MIGRHPVAGPGFSVAGGALIFFSGAILFAVSDPFFSEIFQICGSISLILGTLVVIGGLVMYADPERHTAYGALILVASVFGLLISPIGGILGIVGGVMGIAWKPRTSPGPMRTCPSCFTPVYPWFVVCPNCGISLIESPGPPPQLSFAADQYPPEVPLPDPPPPSAYESDLAGIPFEATDDEIPPFNENMGVFFSMSLEEALRGWRESRSVDTQSTDDGPPEEIRSLREEKLAEWKDMGFDVSKLEGLQSEKKEKRFEVEFERLRKQIEG